MLQEIIKHENYIKRFYHTYLKIYGMSLFVIFLLYVSAYISRDVHVIEKIIYISLMLYYFLLQIISINLLANKNKFIKNWEKIFSIVQAMQFIFFTILAILNVYILSNLTFEVHWSKPNTIIIINNVCLIFSLIFWKFYVSVKFHELKENA